MLVYSPCLYLHDYSIFIVTTEPEQNWGFWKVRDTQREQRGHNSNETSWGGRLLPQHMAGPALQLCWESAFTGASWWAGHP